MSVSQRFIDFMNAHVAPVARRMENQPHISAIRDGFIVVLPFLIVGSFIMILLIPPFDENTQNAFGQAWWRFAGQALTVGISSKCRLMRFHYLPLPVSPTTLPKPIKESPCQRHFSR